MSHLNRNTVQLSMFESLFVWRLNKLSHNVWDAFLFSIFLLIGNILTLNSCFLSNHAFTAEKLDRLHEPWIWTEFKAQPTRIQRKISLTHSFYVCAMLKKCNVVITNGSIQRILPRWHLHQCCTGMRLDPCFLQRGQSYWKRLTKNEMQMLLTNGYLQSKWAACTLQCQRMKALSKW